MFKTNRGQFGFVNQFYRGQSDSQSDVDKIRKEYLEFCKPIREKLDLVKPIREQEDLYWLIKAFLKNRLENNSFNQHGF